MKLFKKLLGIAIVTFMLTSCGGYTVLSNGKGCGVWYPKKYSGKVKQRGNAHMVTF